MSEHYDHQCHICWEEEDDDDVATSTAISVVACCPHISYHRTCLLRWMQISNTCPFCRAEITIAAARRTDAQFAGHSSTPEEDSEHNDNDDTRSLVMVGVDIDGEATTVQEDDEDVVDMTRTRMERNMVPYYLVGILLVGATSVLVSLFCEFETGEIKLFL